MKKDINTKITTYVYLAIILVTIGYDYFFKDGQKLFKGILLCVVVIILRILFTKTFLKRSQSSYFVTLVFTFLSIYLANLWDFYNFPKYDKFLHVISGILLALFGLVIYVNLTRNDLETNIKSIITVLFPLIFSIASAGVWEIWEFTTDSLFGLCAQNNSLLDTMQDIICGTVGGIISTIFIYLWYKGKKNKMIEQIVNEAKIN